MKWIFVAMPKEAERISAPEENIVITGIGAKNVIKTISNLIKDGRIKDGDSAVNVGYVGSAEFIVGDVVTIDESVKYIKPRLVEEEMHRLIPFPIKTSKCYTADDFCEKMPEKGVVDMELFYLASFFKNIKSIKIVSDNGRYDDYKENVKDVSWDKVNKILREEIKWKE